MTGTLAPPVADVPRLLASEVNASQTCLDGEALRSWLTGLLQHRKLFGITRVGSLTRLDRIGLPVVQVVRPLALSNAVSQGKGVDMISAAASGVMEALETWAAERIPEAAIRIAVPFSLGRDLMELYSPWVDGAEQTEWSSLNLPWIDGWDLIRAAPKAVPLALVDTVYTCPSPHPPIFPRVTTGLGAGPSLTGAIVQAGLEVLERHALVRARRIPYFYERFQVNLSTVGSGAAGPLLHKVQEAGLAVAAWCVPGAHDLSVYRCHVMEAEWPMELAPMPAEGSACRFTGDDALLSALLEACQARVAAIAGSREDMTRRMYPNAHDRKNLGEWLDQIRSAGSLPHITDRQQPDEPAKRLRMIVDALQKAGAQAIIVVPLFMDRKLGVHVVRVVAPPLHLWPGGIHG